MNKKRAFSPDIDLDKTSAEPLHLQLSRAIRMQIRQNRPESGTRLLSERKLAEAGNLDRSTVHRAYGELIKDGVIEQQPPKKGFFITPEAHAKLKQPFPTIGVVIPIRFSDYLNEMMSIRLGYLNGIIEQAAKFECTIMMIQLPDANRDREFIEDWLRHVIDRLDGIVHLGDRRLKPDLPLEMLLDYSSVPQIFISAFCGRPGIGTVTADSIPGGLGTAELLCEKGHHNVGTVSWQPEKMFRKGICKYEVDLRLQKILDSFESLGLNIMDEWKLYSCDNVEKIETKLKKIYTGSKTPTAFWCLNDEIALKTIKALRNIGLRVPEDVSIIGYDDLSNTENTALTTIRYPFYSIGCKAIDLLINYYQNNIKTTNQTIEVPTSLVIRDTVAKANPNQEVIYKENTLNINVN